MLLFENEKLKQGRGSRRLTGGMDGGMDCLWAVGLTQSCFRV